MIIELIFEDRWSRPGDGASMKVQVHRLPGGILYEMYEGAQRVFLTFSPRPYTLGQSCDGTIDACVFALFFDFCRTFGLDPDTVYREAYPDAEPSDAMAQEEIIDRAKAEGVVFPEVWDVRSSQGLLDSLTEINNHSLVGVLTESEAGWAFAAEADGAAI